MILSGHDPQAIALALQRICAGGLLGLPTETVYGLAADADNDAAVAQIFATKGRPLDHPLIVHVPDAGSVMHYAQQVPAFAQRLMAAFWPGPLTLIFQRQTDVAQASAAGQATLALRCPQHPVALALLKALSQTGVAGLAAPSANPFGRISPTKAAHVEAEFGPQLLILDGGDCTVGIESTIIDCSREQPLLLRPGMITPQCIWRRCGIRLVDHQQLPNSASRPTTPGSLASHYAPTARLRLLSTQQLHRAHAAYLATAASAPAQPELAIWSRLPLAPTQAQYIWQAMPDRPKAAAQQLFATLRQLDAQGVQQIWVQAPPDSPGWSGVRDRLQRAAR